MTQLKGVGEKIGIVGTVGGAASVIEPLKQSAEYDFLLRHTAITEGFNGPAAEAEIKRFGQVFNKEALATGQTSASIAEAFRDLIQSGMTAQLAEKLIGVHSHAATAYGIRAEELGHAVFALGKTLNIDEKSMPLALAGMAQASKEGLFKVKDFSTYLTGQSGTAAGLGLQGVQGAATLFALNEIVAQRSTNPQQAGEITATALNYISSRNARTRFQHAGIDLNA